jgi:hypothetical protein
LNQEKRSGNIKRHKHKERGFINRGVVLEALDAETMKLAEKYLRPVVSALAIGKQGLYA